MAENIAIQNLVALAQQKPNDVVVMGNLLSLFREVLSESTGDLLRSGTVTGATSQAQEFVNGTTTTGVTNSVTINENNVYITDGVHSVQLLPSGVIKVNGTDVTPTIAALTKTDDTNVTLTLGGTPSTALLKAVSLTLGWTGTLADARIASASTWNAKQSAITTGTTSQYFRGDLSLATFPTSAGQYPGTTTNDSPTAGNIGQQIISTVSSGVSYSASATYEAATSIALTAGNWEISAFFTYDANGATITAANNAIFLIGSVSASTLGSTEGLNVSYIPQAALLGTSKFSDSIPPYNVSLALPSTTFYLNTQATFSIGAPKYVCTLRAIRVR